MRLSKRKIDMARAKSAMIDKEIAERYGASISGIRRLFADKDVYPSTAGRLAKALNVDVSEILEDEEGAG